jgi:nucleoside-diphosphate-sugar epimerase
MPQLFCFGLGYCALHYLRAARIESAAGTVRDRAQDGVLPGLRTFPFDRSCEELRAALAESGRVLVSVPPDAEGDPVLRSFGDALRPGAVIVYLSSLGVYGDYGGAVVTEESECRPQFARSRARLQAEREWMRYAQSRDSRLLILRLAGIYGPQRNALAQVSRSEARRIAKPGQVFNRIHVADIAGAIAAAFEWRESGIFNIADDEPSPPGDPILFAAQLLGVPAPPEIPFDAARRTMSPIALSFYEECRRADNSRMKSVLGVDLQYPSYREGLRALFEAGDY